MAGGFLWTDYEVQSLSVVMLKTKSCNTFVRVDVMSLVFVTDRRQILISVLGSMLGVRGKRRIGGWNQLTLDFCFGGPPGLGV